MKKAKGFTLVEIMVVVAIIGILAAVATPNMFGRIQTSKQDSADSQARSIFNSAQTIIQKYETLDRSIADTDKRFLRNEVQKTGKNSHYFGNISNTKIDTEKSAANNKVGTEFYSKLRAMNTHLDNGKWIIIVENYKVTHVLWAEDENTKYVGVYCGCKNTPHKKDERFKDGKNLNDVLSEVETPPPGT